MSANNSAIAVFSGKNLCLEDVAEFVEELRKLILEDNKLKDFRTDDAYLLRFLYATYFNVRSAFKRMQCFRDLMFEHPNWFATIPPLDKKQQIERNDRVLLRGRDRQGRAILLQKLGKIDAINSSPAEQAQIYDMWLELVMDDPKIQAAGVSVIVDMDGYSWKLFKWLTPLNIRTGVKKVDLYPFHEVLIHIVNTSFLLNATIKLMWPFLSERIKNMIKFHYDNWASLHEYISPDILPAEYGGTGPDIDYEKSNQLLFDQNAEIEAKLKFQIVPRQ